MELYSASKKNKNLSFPCKWIEPENIILSKVSQAQKAKNHKFSLNADYRHKTNAVILLDMGHTLMGECAQEE
jgi:regulator of extracellular matrix RemA (YlzA/DUF370 family)